jgi:hypothetical protein
MRRCRWWQAAALVCAWAWAGAAAALDDGLGLAVNGGAVSFDYGETLVSDPALNAKECIFTTTGTTGGGFVCEGTTANANEQLYAFPAVDGADTTSFIIVDVTETTDIDGGGLAITAGVLAVGAGNAITVNANDVAVTANSIDDAEVADDSLTAASLAVDSVTASEIATGAVATAEILDDTVDFADVNYANTLAGDPALGVEECWFTTDGAGGGGFICEGTAANTNEQLYLFPTNDFPDAPSFLVTDVLPVTNVDADGLLISSSAVSIDLLDANDGTGAIASDSGLEFQGAGSDELTLLQGCSDGQVLKWDDVATDWECQADNDSGGSTALNNIGDATADGTVLADDFDQNWLWDSPATATAIIAMQFEVNHDATTDATTQTLVQIERNATAGTTTFERLLYINNADTDGLVADGILVEAAAGAMTDGLDVSDADIVNGVSLGNNNFVFGSSTWGNGSDFTLTLNGTSASDPTIAVEGSDLVFDPGNDAGSDIIIRDASPSLQLDDSTVVSTPDEFQLVASCVGVGDCGFAIAVANNSGSTTVFEVVDTADDHSIEIGSTTATDSMLFDLTGDGGGFTFNNSTVGMPLTGTTSTECVMLDATAIVSDDSGGCTTATKNGTNFSYRTCDFATGADNRGFFTFELPDNLAGTTASVSFTWISNNAACDSGADDDVCWTIDGDSFANDAAYHTGALGGTLAAVTDNCIANGDLLRTSAVTFTHSWVAGERAAVEIGRDVDGGNCAGGAGDDDYAQNAELLAVRVCYEVDNVFSGE